jgi:hypothetical protein
MNTIIKYENTNNLVKDICTIIDEAQKFAYQTVDTTLVLRNWYIGKRIDEEVLEGKDRAKYGAEVIDKLSKELTGIYGKGYSKRILYQCLKVYRMFPRIVNEARSQLGVLSWTHYRILTQVEDTAARQWYEKEAYDQVWSTTTLQRNVSSQYYRILKSLDKQTVEDEIKELTSSYQNKFMFSLK